ncbi:MAG TPA: phosphotransferase [Mycobacteriales bacterium]|nr:phosphotransferase [Mycobacteriales bacterium]
MQELDGGTARGLADRFGLGRVDGPAEYVDRGVSGEVFRLSTSAGRWALKRLLSEPAFDQIETEVRLQDAAREAGVPSPGAVRAAGGEIAPIVDGQRWRVSEWVDASFEVEQLLRPANVHAVGEILARIHALQLRPPHGISPWLTTPPPPDEWAALGSAAQRSGVAWAGQFVALAPEFSRLTEIVASAPLSAPVLSHCDLGPANVAVAGERLIVLDWERAGAVPPIQEFGYVLVQWFWDEGRLPLAADFTAGYGGAPDSGLDLFAVAICAWLNFLRGMAGAALHGATDRRAYATARVVEMVGDPLTTASLERLLAAAVRP